jgi:hypothetical protein
MEYLLIMQNEAGGRKKAQSGFVIVTGAWMRGGVRISFSLFLKNAEGKFALILVRGSAYISTR